MKKLLNHVLPIFALCALAACTDSDDATSSNTPGLAPDGGKALIAFSPDGRSMTRAGDDATGFTNPTKVVMRIKAQNGTATDNGDYRYTQAIMTAAAQVSNDDCNTKWHLVGAHSHLSYVTSPTNYVRYWDDAFGRSSKLTVYALAIPDQAAPTNLGDNILDHANENIDVVDASTNPNWYTIKSSATENTKVTWTLPIKQEASTLQAYDLAFSNNIRADVGTNNEKMKGRYKQTWNGATSDWDKSMEWGRLEWEPQANNATVGKFDQGHLVFQHALTYLEINLYEGTGFKAADDSDFKWTSVNSGSTQSLKLKYFPITGQLDLTKALNADGQWTPTNPTVGTDDIIQLKETRSNNGDHIKLEGFVIPGTTLSGNTDNLIEFEIDDTKYYVTGNQIATAITTRDDTKTAEAAKTLAGKHYIINLKVGKKEINSITASILPWEEVNTAETEADNTHFTFALEDRGDKLGSGDGDKFDLYRAERTASDFIDNIANDGTPITTTTYDYLWETGYTAAGNMAAKAYNSTTNRWGTTNWYWESNKIWYHFRAAGIGESPSGSVTIRNSTDGDYFTIQHGPISGDESYKDWVWGAPFADTSDGYKFIYTSNNGFAYQSDETTYQIAPAIAATTDVINMLLFHMTSQITVNLTTTADNDKVTLQDGDNKATVKIVRFLPTGKVRMGTGKVEADGTRDTGTGVAMTITATTHTAPETNVAEALKGYTYGMVPQSLNYDGGTIGLEITTPDNNTYYVRDLSTITGTVTETNIKIPYSGTAGNYVIDRWYPSFKYTYNITLKKKGILDITAAVLPWEVVEGDNINIDLEN